MLCASRHPRQIVRADDRAARHRLAARQAVRARRRPARSRPRLAPAERHRRSPGVAADPGARAGSYRNPDGSRRGASAGFRAPPLSGAVHRRHRDLNSDLLQREGRPPRRLLPVGDERVVSGRVEYYGGMPQMAHPDLRAAARRARPSQADRAGLPADRRPDAARRAKSRRSRARTPAGNAGMDRSGIARAARLARMGRGRPQSPRSRERSRPLADDDGARAARL